MNETLKLIQNLKSVRKFTTKEISDEDLKEITDAAVRAANASGRQSYSIIVVEDKKTMKEYIGYAGSKALIFCVDFNRIVDTAQYIKQSFFVRDIQDFITGATDTVLAAQTACIAAKSMGVDSLFTNSIHRSSLTDFYK